MYTYKYMYAHIKRNNHPVPYKGGGFEAQPDKVICSRPQGTVILQVKGSLL